MRKKDHIRLALADKTKVTSLDSYAIDYNSIPLFGLDDVDTSTSVCRESLGISILHQCYNCWWRRL